MENPIVKRQQGCDFWMACAVVGWYEIFGTAMLIFAINSSFNHPFGIALVLFEAILQSEVCTGDCSLNLYATFAK